MRQVYYSRRASWPNRSSPLILPDCMQSSCWSGRLNGLWVRVTLGVHDYPTLPRQVKLLLRCAEPASAAASADAEAAAVGLNEPAERGQMRQFGRAQIAVCELGFSHAVGHRSRGKCVDSGTLGLQAVS